MINKLKSNYKIHRWWDGQLPLMMAVIYYELSCAKKAPNILLFVGMLLLFLVGSVGIATFGYLLNDLTDLDRDRQSGASNLLTGLRKRAVARQFLGVILLGLLPWLVLPHPPVVMVLIGVEYLLFIGYSCKPLRLKERGLPGSVFDALYGYTVPMLVSEYTFAQLAGVYVSPYQSLALALWSVTLGLRHILVHQLKDAGNDVISGTATTVTRFGWSRIMGLTSRYLIQAETTLFIAVCVAVLPHAPLMLPGFLLYALWNRHIKHHYSLHSTQGPIGRTPQVRLAQWSIKVMSGFHKHWFPLLMFPTLLVKNPLYAVIALLHCWLFEHGIRVLVKYELPELARIRNSWSGNYP